MNEKTKHTLFDYAFLQSFDLVIACYFVDAASELGEGGGERLGEVICLVSERDGFLFGEFAEVFLGEDVVF